MNDIDVEDFVGLDNLQEETSDELRMNLELLSESLRMLFRIAVLVRKANPDNRFERAIHSSKFTFPHTFDTDYVREKYPKLSSSEQSWLADRLGKAIARRRQFIKYCRDHSARLALDDENIEADGTTTVLQSSKATTLPPEKILPNFAIDDYEDDIISTLSTSTTTDVLSTLALPRLVDLSKDGEPLECPICLTLRSIKGERSWRLHAFHDLRPYSCTIGGAECESLAFQHRDSWFQHELDYHRSQYACSLCKCGLFTERAGLRSHILGSHGQFPEHQLQIMEDSGRKYPTSFKAQGCPFCNDWSAALQEKEKSRFQGIEPQNISVRVSRFKRHVGAHLEQLAIFAIPRAVEDIAGDKLRSDSNSFSARPWSTDSIAQDVQHLHEKVYSREGLSDEEDLQTESESLAPLNSAAEEAATADYANIDEDIREALKELGPADVDAMDVTTDVEQEEGQRMPVQTGLESDFPKGIQTRVPTNVTTEVLTYDPMEEDTSSTTQDDLLNSSKDNEKSKGVVNQDRAEFIGTSVSMVEMDEPQTVPSTAVKHSGGFRKKSSGRISKGSSSKPRARPSRPSVWRCCKCSGGWFSYQINDNCPMCQSWRCDNCEYSMG
ncbi:hypothetical protein V8C42DRAFT_45430 [Trichoderma barbatum]